MALELEKANEKPETALFVNSYQAKLKINGQLVTSSYGKVAANSSRVTLSNLVALITDRNTGVDPSMIKHVASLLHEEIIRQLQVGRSVELLGLGTAYLGVKCSYGMNKLDPKDIKNIVLKFKPSRGVKKAIKVVDVGSVREVVVVPEIKSIEDMKSKHINTDLKKGTVVKITGKRLRVEGNKNEVGLYIVGANGQQTKINKQDIFRNDPSTLEFILPSSIATGEVVFKIVNQGKFKDNFSRSLREGISEFVVEII